MNKVTIAFGKLLKTYRKRNNNMTQEQLGQIINCSRASVNYYETGKQTPALDFAYDTLKLLNYKLSDLETVMKEHSNAN